MPPKDVKKSMSDNNCVKLSVSFVDILLICIVIFIVGVAYICPRYVRVPMTSGSIWWTDLKFSITPDGCHVSRGGV